MNKTFLQVIPFSYSGKLATRPKEDYLALPSNVALTAGFESEIICLNYWGYNHGKTNNSNLNKKIKLNYVSSTNYLKYLFKNKNKLVVYANSRTPYSFLSTFFSKQSILISHDCEPPSTKFRRAVFRFFQNKFNYHIVNTPYEKQVLLNLGVKKNKIIEIPLSVDVEFYSKKLSRNKDLLNKYSLQSNKIKITFLANMRSHKSPITLLKAIKELPKNYVLMIIGEDMLEKENLKSVKTLCSELEISNRVFMLGKRSPEEIREIFSVSDIYCHPTFREGQCLAVYEAAAAGLPLCLSSIGSFTSVFEGIALFHDPYDHKKLAENIKLMASKKVKINKSKLKKVLDSTRYEVVKAKLTELFRGMAK